MPDARACRRWWIPNKPPPHFHLAAGALLQIARPCRHLTRGLEEFIYLILSAICASSGDKLISAKFPSPCFRALNAQRMLIITSLTIWDTVGCQRECRRRLYSFAGHFSIFADEAASISVGQLYRPLRTGCFGYSWYHNARSWSYRERVWWDWYDCRRHHYRQSRRRQYRLHISF